MHTTFVLRKDQIKFAYWWDRCLLLHEELNLGWRMLQDGRVIDSLVSQLLVLRMAFCINMKHKMAKICLKPYPKSLEILSSSQAKTYWPSFSKLKSVTQAEFKKKKIERWHNPVQRCDTFVPRNNVLPTSRSISTVQLKFSGNFLTDTPKDVFAGKF